LITNIQTSYESGPLFVLLHKFFSSLSVNDLKSAASNAGISADDLTAFKVYTAGVLFNAGNYKGFGDSKIIPGLDKDKFEAILKLSPNWSELQSFWSDIGNVIYDLRQGNACLGFPPDACTTYFSKNCTKADSDLVNTFLKDKKFEAYMTRCFKTTGSDGKVEYEIRSASENISKGNTEEYKGARFTFTTGDYSKLMGMAANELEKAIPHAANDNQKNMLKAYVQSFRTGSLDEHKNGSRWWIKDKGPAVETYIGFIETYRDPSGVRGEWEGFVAAVNREMSARFATLVNNAEKILPLLPWNKQFEKDTFLRPDFTSLDVITFAGSGIPAGINIPNYDEIRQSEGFKNVSLGNVITTGYQQTNVPFLNDSDQAIFQKYRVGSFEVQVGLHELLGHGSGKMFMVKPDGTKNFDPQTIDPLTGQPITSWYEQGDTYDSCFGTIGSSYEECRAEAVGLFLSLEPSIMKIFNFEGQEADDVMYANWLSLCWAGVVGLEMWDKKRGWLQAHCQARHALLRVLMQAGIVKVTQVEPNNLLLEFDRESYKCSGRVAIGHFLLQLQVYKATCNVKAAEELYKHFTEIKEPWVSYRDIVIAHKRPRKIYSLANMYLGSDGKTVDMKAYDETCEGVIQSWVERYENPASIYDAIMDCVKADSKHF